MNDEFGVAVLRGGVAVDDDEVLAFEIINETGGRVNSQRGAGDDEAVGLLDFLQGAAEDVVVEGFFIEDDVGLDDAAVFRAARDAFAAAHKVEVIEAAAGHAVVAHDGAVELVDFFAACHLVQAVDVLCDDGGELAVAFQLGEFVVDGAWAVVGRDHFGAVEFKEFFGVGVEKAAAEHGFRVVFEAFLVVKAVFAAEVRNAAFCGDAGAAEKDNARGVVDDGF